MWEVNEALSENTRWEQLADGRWKAEYNGFVKVTAEGDTPASSEKHLSRAMDTLLASIIRGGKDRKPKDMTALMRSVVLTDAIEVVRKTARQTPRQQTAKKTAGQP